MEMLEMRHCEFVYFGLFYRGYESNCFYFRLPLTTIVFKENG